MTVLQRRIQEKSIPVTECGCWLWLGARFNHGYGQMRVNGKLELAHRISYRAFQGPFDERLHILHSCDNVACVNPSHLRPGTHVENMRDMYSRNRSASGERSGVAKLSDAAVREIRQSGKPDKVLADKYGVHPSHVCRVRNGKRRQGAANQ